MHVSTDRLEMVFVHGSVRNGLCPRIGSEAQSSRIFRIKESGVKSHGSAAEYSAATLILEYTLTSSKKRECARPPLTPTTDFAFR